MNTEPKTAGMPSTVALGPAAAAGTTQRSLRQQLSPPDRRTCAPQTAVWLETNLRQAAGLVVGASVVVSSVRAALIAGTVFCLVPAGPPWPSPVRRLTNMPSATSTPAKGPVHAS